jgi:hypothetical protein
VPTIRQTTNPGGAGRGDLLDLRRGRGLDWREDAFEDRASPGRGWGGQTVQFGPALADLQEKPSRPGCPRPARWTRLRPGRRSSRAFSSSRISSTARFSAVRRVRLIRCRAESGVMPIRSAICAVLTRPASARGRRSRGPAAARGGVFQAPAVSVQADGPRHTLVPGLIGHLCDVGQDRGALGHRLSLDCGGGDALSKLYLTR